MAKSFAGAAAFWLLLFACTGAGSAQQSGGPTPASAPPLKINSGDLIQVTMFENPDLSGNFRVDEKGDITVPLIGRVHVEGATAEEAAALIEKRFVEAQILQPAESHATVFIVEYATQGITVNGEVKNPGVYPALGVRMLNDVVAAAGGVTVAASSKVVITHRNDPGNPVTVDYNPEALKPVIPDVQIFPGDSIMVPRAGIVYVMGGVNRAGGYVLDGRNTLTVEEAMALAGGSSHAAALKRVQLVRSLEDGRKEAITIPVNLIYKGQAPDVAMKDGDVLFVPTSTAKLVTEQAITSALGIGTSIAIYKVAYQP
ncbi:MAG: polysaccharide biosynthesis/export family protein [Terracidiphilus sp.]